MSILRAKWDRTQQWAARENRIKRLFEASWNLRLTKQVASHDDVVEKQETTSSQLWWWDQGIRSCICPVSFKVILRHWRNLVFWYKGIPAVYPLADDWLFANPYLITKMPRTNSVVCNMSLVPSYMILPLSPHLWEVWFITVPEGVHHRK